MICEKLGKVIFYQKCDMFIYKCSYINVYILRYFYSLNYTFVYDTSYIIVRKSRIYISAMFEANECINIRSPERRISLFFAPLSDFSRKSVTAYPRLDVRRMINSQILCLSPVRRDRL